MMATEVAASVMLQEGLHFEGSVATGHRIDLDAPGVVGSAGASPMELVLLGLAGCSAMDVISILRKQRLPVEGLDVHVRGQRRNEHPTVFNSIQIEYVVHGTEIDPALVERAITLSRDRYCPVWAMLGPSVPITPAFRVVSGDLAATPLD
jgi:putative redox protein